MYTFRHITQFIPIWNMKQLHYERIYPHLINTVTIWGTDDRSNLYVALVAPLHLIHKKIIRILCHTSPTAHAAPLYERLKILNMYNLYTSSGSALNCCCTLKFTNPRTVNPPKQTTAHSSLVAQQHEHKTRYWQLNRKYISEHTETTSHAFTRAEGTSKCFSSIVYKPNKTIFDNWAPVTVAALSYSVGSS
jgi:hypothetical protein